MTRVLLIDDEPFYYKIMAPALEKAGYQLEYARSGNKGLELISIFKPDIMVLDLVLPDIDGFEIVQRVRRDPEFGNIPVIFITSHDELDNKLKAFDLGGDDYLVKPFQTEELVARLGILVRRGQAIKLVQQMEARQEVRTTMVAVHSLRGGVGCTSLAVNLALSLFQIWNKPTLLMDSVLSAGQVALMLDGTPKATWETCMNISPTSIDDRLITEVASKHRSGIHYVAAPRYPIADDTFDREFWITILKKFEQQHDYIVVDTDHDFSDLTITMLNKADQILLLVAPEMASLRAAVSALYIYDRLGYGPDKVKMILNHNTNASGIRQEKLERVIKRDFDFVLPYEPREVLHALNFGEPFVLKKPDLPVSAMVEDIAYAISDPYDKNLPPAAPSAAWKRVNNRITGKNR